MFKTPYVVFVEVALCSVSRTSSTNCVLCVCVCARAYAHVSVPYGPVISLLHYYVKDPIFSLGHYL